MLFQKRLQNIILYSNSTRDYRNNEYKFVHTIIVNLLDKKKICNLYRIKRTLEYRNIQYFASVITLITLFYNIKHKNDFEQKIKFKRKTCLTRLVSVPTQRPSTIFAAIVLFRRKWSISIIYTTVAWLDLLNYQSAPET